jgi:hypothetical protein
MMKGSWFDSKMIFLCFKTSTPALEFIWLPYSMGRQGSLARYQIGRSMKLAAHLYLLLRYRMHETILPFPNILASIPSLHAQGHIYCTFILGRQLIKIKTFREVFIVITKIMILNVNGKYSITAIRKVTNL